jgi:hypothetical protein
VITRRVALLACVLAITVCVAAPARAASPTLPRGVLVVFVPGVSLEQLLAHPAVRALASRGGAGLVPASEDPRATVVEAFPHMDVVPLGGGTVDLRLLLAEQGLGPGAPPLSALDGQLRRAVAQFDVGRLLVAVIGESPSASMRAVKDELLPVVVGIGPPGSVLNAAGRAHALTSDSTRRAGVIVAADVPTTIDRFVGHAIAGNPERAAQPGSPIRVVRDADAPFELHERYLSMRRIWVPVQTAAALYVTIAGVFALVVLWLGRRAPAALGVIATGAAISVGPLAAALLEAGHLPTLSYATVIPFVVVVPLAVTALVLLGAAREGILHPVLPLGVLLLLVLVVESLLGWTAALTPFLGGSELDGGRFYGLPNVFIGLLLGASMYAASRLPPSAGFAILLGAGLFAGAPWAGANLGGAVTLFAAAGLWLPLRARGRLGWRELVFAAVVVVVGTALVLLANRFSSLPTHITAFERTRGAGGAWSTFVHRLGVGVDLIAHNPFALLPVVGMLVTLVVVLRRPSLVAPSLERHPAWRDALLVLLLSSVVAYLANDTGAAACGVGFGMALGGLLYVSVAERTWKMVPA